MRPPISAKRQLAAEVLAVLAAVGAFYALYLDPTHMQSGGDYANLFWPMKEFGRETLAGSGVFPLWNPYIFLGSPAAATMQHAVFYPIDLLFFRSSPLLAELNLYNFFHLLLCGVGAWWWMRFGLGAGAAGAILTGAAFPCTAWFWGAQEHINQVAAVAWMPWMLGAAWMAGRGGLGSLRFIVIYSALGAMQFLVGHPQAAFYTHGAAALILVAGSPLGGEGARRLVMAAGCFAGAGVLTALLVSVQLLPGLELTPLASRHQFDPAWSFSYSMMPDLLTAYLHPHRFGSYAAGYQDMRAYNEYGLFVGVPVLMLAMGELLFQALQGFSPGRRVRRAPVLMAVVIGVTLLMALGGNVSLSRLRGLSFTEFPLPARLDPEHGLSLHDLYVALIPTASGFRVPARIVILTALAWTTLAGLGADRAVRELRRRNLSLALTHGLAVVLVGAVWTALYLPSRVEKFRHPVESAPLLLAWSEDIDLRARRSLDDRVFRLTISDDALLKANRQLDTEPEENAVWLRWMRLFENDNVVLHVPSVTGYEEGLAPTIRTKDFLLEFNRHFRSFHPDPQFLALLGVSRLFADLPIDEGAFPPIPGESRGPRRMFQVPGAGGAAFWEKRAEGIDFARFDGPRQRLGAKPLTAYQDALVDYGAAPQWNVGLPALMTNVTNPNRVVIRSSGPPPGDAILAMGQYPGWTLDGQPVEWLNAVHARIPAVAFRDGEATLVFQPASHKLGLLLSGLGLAAWFAGLTLSIRRREDRT